MNLDIVTKNSRETQKLAIILAEEVAAHWDTLFGKKGAAVLAFEGDLGAGKTTFIQGFARGLGIKEKVLSPTFVILKKFKITKGKAQNAKRKTTIQNPKPAGFESFYHFDCYRVENPREILDLGFKEIIGDSRNIVVIEWAERIKKILPKSSVWMKFEWIDKNKRRITIRQPETRSVKRETRTIKTQTKSQITKRKSQTEKRKTTTQN